MFDSTLLPVLALRDIVVFPHMVVSLFVGREKSVLALDEVMKGEKQVMLVTQKNAADDDPGAEAIYGIGVLANVLQLLRLPDGTVKVLVEGKSRAKIKSYKQFDPFIEAEVYPFVSSHKDSDESLALMRAVKDHHENYQKLMRKNAAEATNSLPENPDPELLADTIAAQLSVKISDKQELLEQVSVARRLERIYAIMEGEISVLNVEKKIRSRVKRQMEKTQREYYLNEQMKAIQRELGDQEDGKDELKELEKKITATKLSKEARTKAKAELAKLKNMSPMSAESTVVRNYLDWLLAVPWGPFKPKPISLEKAETILESDHYGLEKVKERIIEHLAVQARTGSLKGPILCLVGPPGVGKTSLGKSIAKATGREFIRISLGGVRDESEIRGHRRTYIGSMPGKIIQSMKKVKTTNVLILLDEIDKLGADWRGDPSSALLEVLDPAQNSTFNDHYLEVDYDLSNVMFVTTANSLNMPQPLRDRMEIIRISGYTEDEKIEIAKRHIIPNLAKDHALGADEWSIDDLSIRDLIRYYTREAGVRSLERELSNLARKSIRELTREKKTSLHVDLEKMARYAGVQKYHYGETDNIDQIGVVNGLAWTEFGGEILTIEAIKMPGKGQMKITGNLKEVMKESISAANSYVRALAPKFGILPPLFDRTDVHVHVPEGATPKDGPSAGVAMVTAMVSVLTGNPVRKDVAMTGEITLRGRVLAIGGLKEKLLAAMRSGVKKVLIPQENLKDLADIPQTVRQSLEIVAVTQMDEVLSHALMSPLVSIHWIEPIIPPTSPKVIDDESDSLTTH